MEPCSGAAALPSIAALRRWLIAATAAELNLDPSQLDPTEPFVNLGLDSVAAVGLAGELEAWLGHPIDPTVAWDYPTIDALAAHLAGGPEATAAGPCGDEGALGAAAVDPP